MPQYKKVRAECKLLLEQQTAVAREVHAEMIKDAGSSGTNPSSLPLKPRGKRSRTANIEAILQASVKPAIRRHMLLRHRKWVDGAGSMLQLDHTAKSDAIEWAPLAADWRETTSGTTSKANVCAKVSNSDRTGISNSQQLTSDNETTGLVDPPVISTKVSPEEKELALELLLLSPSPHHPPFDSGDMEAKIVLATADGSAPALDTSDISPPPPPPAAAAAAGAAAFAASVAGPFPASTTADADDKWDDSIVTPSKRSAFHTSVANSAAIASTTVATHGPRDLRKQPSQSETVSCPACLGRMVCHSCGMREKPIDYEAIAQAEREKKEREEAEKQRLRMEKRKAAEARRREARRKKKEEEEQRRREEDQKRREEEERMKQLEAERFEQAHIQEQEEDNNYDGSGGRLQSWHSRSIAKVSYSPLQGLAPSDKMNASTPHFFGGAAPGTQSRYENEEHSDNKFDYDRESSGPTPALGHGDERAEDHDPNSSYRTHIWNAASPHRRTDDDMRADEHATNSQRWDEIRQSYQKHESFGSNHSTEALHVDGVEVKPSTALSTSDALAALAGLAAATAEPPTKLQNYQQLGSGHNGNWESNNHNHSTSEHYPYKYSGSSFDHDNGEANYNHIYQEQTCNGVPNDGHGREGEGHSSRYEADHAHTPLAQHSESNKMDDLRGSGDEQSFPCTSESEAITHTTVPATKENQVE